MRSNGCRHTSPPVHASMNGHSSTSTPSHPLMVRGTSHPRWLVCGAFIAAAAVTCSYLYYKKNENKDTKKRTLQLLLLSDEQLKRLVKHMKEEMELGLSQNSNSTLKMLPTFVSKPTGKEKGTFYALDLGGTNFRVIKLELKGGELGKSAMKKFTIGKEAMEGTATVLFDFIANSVKDFIGSEQQGATVLLGFTFSFPVQQTALAAGTLIHWTKGFTTSGVVGQDVVELLNQAFERNHVNAKAIALANDTVGTMVARCYLDPKCEMGVILGTGTNACYAEQVSNIKKPIGNYGGSNMIINMEWGDGKNFLPLTPMDDELDRASKNPGKQRFEKMISGMYLGELARLTLVQMIKNSEIFSGLDTSKLQQRDSFETAMISKILDDKTEDLKEVEKLLQEKFALRTTPQDRILVRDVCKCIAERAAKLSAAAIGAVLDKINRLKDSVVAVDGSVFEHIPGFKEMMQRTLQSLFPDSSVDLQLTTDGSGNGAAIIASTAV